MSTTKRQCMCATVKDTQCSINARAQKKFCGRHEQCRRRWINPPADSTGNTTVALTRKSKKPRVQSCICAISTSKTPILREHSTQVYLVTGDIASICNQNTPTPLAVVNAANSKLSVGGGVTGALVTAVGGATEWHKLISRALNVKGKLAKLPLHVGDVAYTTTDGQLKSNNVDYIIHALGPSSGEPLGQVVDAVTNVLTMADSLGVKSVVLPAISGGIFVNSDARLGKKIRKLILGAIRSYIKCSTKIQKVYLISSSPEDLKLWRST